MGNLFKKILSTRVESAPHENFYISPGLQFFGDLVACASSGRIEGKFEGHIIECKKLIVGPKATIKGNIFAEEVYVYGYCEGDIFASQVINVYGSAVVLGDVHSTALHVETNATFRGNLRKLRPEDYAEKTNSEKERIRLEKKMNVYHIHSLIAKDEIEQKVRKVVNSIPEKPMPVFNADEFEIKPIKTKMSTVSSVHSTPMQQQPDLYVPFEPGVTKGSDVQLDLSGKRWF